MKILLALAAAGVFATSAAAQQTTLTSQEVRATSAAFLAEGEPARAAAFADLILAVNPDDYQALILRTRAALALQDFETATTLAKRAYRATSNSRAKYIAARFAARGHAAQEQDTFAQLWLRRASQFAPDDESRAQVAQDFRAVSRRNPLSTSLRFGISPSSNINNGTEVDTFNLRNLAFPLTPGENARPLSGLEVSLGASTQYRINVTETAATFLNFDIQGRTYILSNETKDKVPDARGSDFSDASLGFGVTHRRVLTEGARPTTFNARVSQVWFSGDPLTRNIDLSVSHDWDIGEVYRIGVRASAQDRKNLDDDPDARVYSLGANWTQVFDNRNRFNAGLTYSVSQSDTLDQDFDSYRLTTNYSITEPFADMLFSFGFDAELRDFDATLFGQDTRTDRKGTLRVRAQFTELEYYGFQPVASLEVTRNDSDVDFFDREFVNFGFDLRSSF